ncbi:DUF58 domain-containing protein [Chakrabartyella piscis]|uniref:DUF58 domain-containing protein n=1 Tax=Chakrabartyella piscis TaxID=2918914 RepID=UPI002958A874|nr:DUF58 domain-containing protein [Chakrabartyella piscis]
MNNENYKVSSYIASPIFMGIAFVLCCACAYGGYIVLSGYLFFLFLLSVITFLWGRFSEHGISVDIKADSYHAYPDQEIAMDFTLQNDKSLPLVWLEWIQEYPTNNCLSIPDDFEVCDVTNPQAEEVMKPMLCKRFSFIRWYETITWTSKFQAKQRGVYLPKQVEIHTGDGFGLCVRKKQFQLLNPPIFVIYPKRIPVATNIFFKNAWSATTGSQGIIEDVTVLRGTREYQEQDSFKRINWRLAARGDELRVNQYETIAPKSVYFFVDTASFFGVSQDNAEFEDTLSVVGSLIEELFAMGMSVGVYLPSGTDEEMPYTESTNLSDCLLLLSYANCNLQDAKFNQERVANLYATQSGNIYYVCYDGNTTKADSLFDDVGIATYSVLAYKEPEENDVSEQQIHLLSTLKRI